MDVTQQGIVTLLKSAVTGKSYPLPEDFSLEALYPLIRKHHMHMLVYQGAVTCGISRKTETMQKLFRDYCRGMLQSEGQMAAVTALCRAFEEAGIDYMPLKGCRMKPLYPKPELRIMSDADILIRMEQYDRIRAIVQSLGYTHKVESDHEYVWQSDRLFLELHKRLIPSYNEDYYAYFGDGWRLAKKQNGFCYSMTAEDELIYLFTHFAKHFRDGGIGCRYVVDLWVYLRTCPELDENYLREELERLQLWEFYGNIRRLIACWFEDGAADGMLDIITDFVFSSGSWGNRESHVLSQLVRQSKRSKVSFSGKLMYLGSSLFPSAKQLKNKYPVVEKAPWMLPLVWVYRPFYKLLKERKDITRKQKDLQAVTTEAVDAKQQMLRFVGLDFHF